MNLLEVAKNFSRLLRTEQRLEMCDKNLNGIFENV